MDSQIYKAIVNAIPDMIIRISRAGVFQRFEGATAELYWLCLVWDQKKGGGSIRQPAALK